ncbi:broad specificity phosphatase PhoE [Cryobacterium sp. MP_M5]|uniref:histidine phosphatase family protein n=1 Tax=unclassified Cryobacterium TaxID=2649013 RepID=UPI0018CB158F|nr:MULTISPECIES: histidine phosphatase family protein [unclassified Cryobacterium]MBG6057999.1 putative phosphoglycerate mutase [Cryobacterium sp. MP_M3]MEC5176198.1 broad specificity phosphatase PhoE [Cryobacterium sp. MP_M5]
MAQNDIVLVRHGQTQWSIAGRHTGRTDIPLTDLGRQQADALGEMLDGRDFSLVLSSPLKRAWETMQRAGYADQGMPDENILEWDYGVFEGRTTADIRSSQPDWSVWTSPIDGGETVDQVGARADLAIERCLAVPGPVSVFAHGHFLRIMTARWMGLLAAAGRHLSLGTATVSTLGWERENRVLQMWNDACHLNSMDPVV